MWRPVGAAPHAPSEMKAWLARFATALRSSADGREVEEEIATVRESINAHEAPLRAHLETLGGSPSPKATWTALVDRAAEVVERVEALGSQHRQIERDLHELEADLAALAATDADEQRQGERLSAAWRAAVTPLGLPHDASPAEATVLIEHLGEAFRKVDLAQEKRRRASGIERDAREFAGDVAALAREHAPDLAAAKADDAAAAMIDRLQRGKTALAERRQLERQRDEASLVLEMQRERASLATSMIAELMDRAAVGSLDALEHAERRSDEATRFDQELARLDAQLLELGGDATSLQAEFEAWDADTAAARLAELELELGELQDRTIVVGTRILGVEEGLKKLDHPEDKAAQAALEAEGALARVRDLAERYVTVRVAATVLAREIERYRQANQGPILARASELFRRLTLGSFGLLKVEFDERDTPILLGVRSDGRELGAPAMSDGTRDQLFLALRIATLERYTEHNHPLPLVVDDILVHFDDERSRAALEILADLSERTQVLFFTHHARLIELAQQAIDPGRLSVCRLGDSPGGAAHLANPASSAIVAPK
jgi:uncharacterized protein YhaN